MFQWYGRAFVGWRFVPFYTQDLQHHMTNRPKRAPNPRLPYYTGHWDFLSTAKIISLWCRSFKNCTVCVLWSGAGQSSVHTGVFKMVMTYSLYTLLHFKFSNGTAGNMVCILLSLHSPRQTNSSVQRTETGWDRVNIFAQNIPINRIFKIIK